MLQYQRGPDTPKGSSKNGVGSLEVLRVLEQLPADEKLVRFFEREGGYEVYADTAILIAGLLFRNVAQFTTVVKELLLERRVEVWAFNAARRSWKVSVRASPGNYEQLEKLVMEDVELAAPVICSVHMRMMEGGQRRIGLAMVDAMRFVIGWTSFVDSELLTNLEAALVQLNAKECIYSKGTDIGGLFATSSCVGTELPFVEFENNSVTDDLSRLLLSNTILTEMPVEVEKALAGIINYLGLLTLDSNLSTFTLNQLNLSLYMRLDETALQALNIFGKSSLFNILDQCKTRQGSALLTQWIRQPLLSIEEIKARADVVEALVVNSVQRQSLRDIVLRGIPDVSRVARRLIKGKANLQDLVLLYTAVAKIHPIYEQLEGIANESMEVLILGPLRELSQSLSKYAELIETTVDFAALSRHEYIVRADFAESLTDIHTQREAILDSIEVEYDRVVRKLGLEKGKKIKLERNTTYGHFFRISRLDGAVLTEDFQELAALKNGIYFVNKSLREFSLRYDELAREYSTAQMVLVREMLEVARTYRRRFDELNQVIAVVDVLQSLAYSAVMAPTPLVRPLVVPMGGPMELKDARHICVETASSAPFIPNNAHFDEASSFQIITGPNMGGKSTYIRQSAIVALLAQIGGFVPCSSARIPIFDALLVRVGAGDSILRGVSTFMMEMLETASILRTATRNSLVVIDELGRGTSTSEGLGLAWGVAKLLARRGCYSFFATHFHEITELASELSNIKNMHASAEIVDGSLLMTFRITEGVCDRSYGVHVARMAGFPAIVIDMAQIMLRDLEGATFTEEQANEGLAWSGDKNSMPTFIKQHISSIISQ
jgi:DNA mismatch repair protein MSH2